MNALAILLSRIHWDDILATVLHVAIILIVGWAVMAAFNFLIARLGRRLLQRTQAADELPSEASKRVQTLIRLLRQAALIFVWASVLLVALKQIGVEIAPLIASVGVLGLAVGFGAQNLVRDVISGFFFILENQVRVGDVAIINGTGGSVEQINFRTIVLRDLAGTVHVFPNGSVETLANMTRDWSAYVFDIRIGYDEDADRVMQLLDEIASQMRSEELYAESIIDDVEIFGVDSLSESAVIIKGRIKTVPVQQWAVGREFLRRVTQMLAREGIAIPYPHRSLTLRGADVPVAVQLLHQAEQGKSAPDADN